MALIDTLGSKQWLHEHEDALKAILPQDWTHIRNLNGMQIGFRLKLLGVDWRSEQEFGKVMVFLEKVGFMERQNGFQVRASRNRVFTTA